MITRLRSCVFSFFLFSSLIAMASQQPPIPYQYNPNSQLSEEEWHHLIPYFLPEDSPEKAELDKIFSKRRVLNSASSMRKAGFLLLTDPKRNIIVAKHPNLKGLLIKAYLDDSDAVEWIWWKKRIDGANIIQESINRHGYQGIMKTPKKWIYPLPSEPAPKNGKAGKHFILIAEEIDVLNAHKNRKAYKTKMTPTILNALYVVITENLLIDSVYAPNVPFCKDGRLAFIDTEHVMDYTQAIPIASIAQYLSSEMYDYWEQLVLHGGPE